MKSSLEEEKWKKFLKAVKVFRFIPFTEFVIASGSLATGKLHERSDFDVIVGVREGRIFTNRAAVLVFSRIFGVNRGGHDHKQDASDKLCLNHFVTSESYRLGGPKNIYWQSLYHSLVPVMGRKEKINEFFEENSDWMGSKRSLEKSDRYIEEDKNWLRSLLEFVLGGWLGDTFEKVVKKIQIRLIERGLPQAFGYKPHFVYSNKELRFHMDTKRIEEMVEKWE